MTIVTDRASGTVELEQRSPVDRARAVQTAQNAFRTSSLDGAQNAPPTRLHKASSIWRKKKKNEEYPTSLQWRASLMEADRQH